jgi:DNA methylase
MPQSRRASLPGFTALVSFPKSLNVEKKLRQMGEDETAERFAGYGSALKPSYEPIVMARKPLAESSIASNVLKHGTGALNVDGCRVQSNANDPNARRATGENGGADSMFGVGNHKRPATLTSGRFPPNLLLSHVPPDENGIGGCRPTGETRRVKAGKPDRFKGTEAFGSTRTMEGGLKGVKINDLHVPHADPDGFEALEEWECAEGCPIFLMDVQSGQSKDGVAVQRNGGGQKIGGNGIYAGSKGLKREDAGYGGQGGASRFFPRFASEAAPEGTGFEPAWPLARCELPPQPDIAVAHRSGDRGNNPSSATPAGAYEDIVADDGFPSSLEPPDLVPFKYSPKASRAERNKGLEGMPESTPQEYGLKTSVDGREGRTQGERTSRPTTNGHPTVKPIALMRWLVRLITPLGGTVLDPFMGSGSTGCAALLEGFNFIGIEMDEEYAETARRRIAYWSDSERLEKPVAPSQLPNTLF